MHFDFVMFRVKTLEGIRMDILLLLIPLSVGLALLVILALWWAVHSDQFEDLEQQGSKILHSD